VKDTRTKDVQEFFERVASDWDAMRLSYYDGRVIEKMAEVSGMDGTMTVADVGTGTGFVAAGIAPRVGRVLAVDNSPAMLGVARNNLAELGNSNVELLQGGMMALPLKDASVEAAFANMVLHHAEDPRAMLREMARVVKAGGVVAITDEVAFDHPMPTRPRGIVPPQPNVIFEGLTCYPLSMRARLHELEAGFVAPGKRDLQRALIVILDTGCFAPLLYIFKSF
jgi:ArsR family transcriptional regulator